MSFSEIQKILYPNLSGGLPKRRFDLVAFLANIDPMLIVPPGKLIARKEIKQAVMPGDVIELEWQIVIDK